MSANEIRRPTKNPNFGKVIEFKKLVLQKEILLWPFLIVRFFERGGVIERASSSDRRPQETSRVVLPLFLFADSFVSQVKIKLSLAMLMTDNH